MIAAYVTLAIICSGLILYLKNSTANQAIGFLFLSAQVGLTGYAFLNQGAADSWYFSFDSLGILLSLVLSILSITTFYHSYLYIKRHPNSPQNISIYYAALILLIASMTGAYFANHVGVLWFWLEVTTVSVSILIYHERTAIAVEAAWKYIFICSIGISFAFLGILFLSALASASGLTELYLDQLTASATGMNITWLKIVFILVLTGFSAKWGLFPLHTVCVDAHTGAPPPISAFISTTLMNVGFLGVFRFYAIISQTDALPWANRVLMICGIVSIALSAMQLLRVKHFKRMFAFSSLEQMGIVALALSVGGIGYFAAILHIILHSFAKAGLFYQIGQVNSVYNSYWIKDTGGYMKVNPLGAVVILLLFIMITAMPPSGLFVSELMVFKALFGGSHYFVGIFALIMLSVIIFVFIKNFAQLLYARDQSAGPVHINQMETVSQFLMIALIIYLAFDPPVFFTNLIYSAISILT